MNTSYTPSVMVVSYREQMHNLDLKIQDLKMQMESMEKKFIEEVIAKGWKQFKYCSEYYGSHRELGECDENVTFFFHPSVDYSVWLEIEFSHGSFSQSENNLQFKKWISELPENHYVEF